MLVSLRSGRSCTDHGPALTVNKDSIDIDYEDEKSLQETLPTDTRIVKLNDRNIKGQSHVYNIIEEQKFHNSQKNSRTDPIARPASIICSISNMACKAPFKNKFGDSIESKKVTIKKGPVSVGTCKRISFN